MAFTCYVEKKFHKKSLVLIEYINMIISEYAEQGYTLTLRQVYYQLVSRDMIENNERSYKNIGSLINDGRLAGLIDWDAIEDRTRMLRGNVHWDSPADIIEATAKQYHTNLWTAQSYHVEVWVEKDALVEVIGIAARKFDVDYFSCRGYTSQSEMHSAARRLKYWQNKGKEIAILHLGDHDPSGIDMSRDIVERLSFFGVDVEFQRLALNFDQIEEYNPPPNPAKMTDPRSLGYIDIYGRSSWELDALDPSIIDRLITSNVEKYIDVPMFEKAVERQEEERTILEDMSIYYSDIAKAIAIAKSRA
ncbi:MAG: hypothetical protein LBN34_03020 [Clostridiales Family XIII bacterium]|jgi:hypothetical protein|nr:hypothetical protein [Clostridiales Family XIII bacterium]